jgi:hypothetical protein
MRADRPGAARGSIAFTQSAPPTPPESPRFDTAVLADPLPVPPQPDLIRRSGQADGSSPVIQDIAYEGAGEGHGIAARATAGEAKLPTDVGYRQHALPGMASAAMPVPILRVARLTAAPVMRGQARFIPGQPLSAAADAGESLPPTGRDVGAGAASAPPRLPLAPPALGTASLEGPMQPTHIALAARAGHVARDGHRQSTGTEDTAPIPPSVSQDPLLSDHAPAEHRAIRRMPGEAAPASGPLAWLTGRLPGFGAVESIERHAVAPPDTGMTAHPPRTPPPAVRRLDVGTIAASYAQASPASPLTGRWPGFDGRPLLVQSSRRATAARAEDTTASPTDSASPDTPRGIASPTDDPPDAILVHRMPAIRLARLLAGPGHPAPAPGRGPEAPGMIIARLGQPSLAHVSPDAAGLAPAPGDVTASAQTSQPPRSAGAGAAAVDVEAIVEQAVQALMARLTIEQERRGFSRWA